MAKGIVDMKVLILTIFTILILGFTGCEDEYEPKADITSPLQYNEENISFSYPKNWTYSGDVTKKVVSAIIVESPKDAMCTILIYAKPQRESFSDYVKKMSLGFNKTRYVNKSKSTFSKILKEKNFSVIEEKFIASILGIEVPYSRKYFRVESDKRVVYLITHTAVEDLKIVQPGYQLIIDTFSVKN